MNNASPMTMSGAAGIIELVGGVLLVIGLFTRPAAFILSGMTAVAYFYAHAPRGFFPILNAGELAALYCFIFLFWRPPAAAPSVWTGWCGAGTTDRVPSPRSGAGRRSLAPAGLVT